MSDGLICSSRFLRTQLHGLWQLTWQATFFYVSAEKENFCKRKKNSYSYGTGNNIHLHFSQRRRWFKVKRPNKKYVFKYIKINHVKIQSAPASIKCVHVHAKSLQLCLTLCDPMDCSPPGSSVHGTLQARILEWAAMPSSRESSQCRNWTYVSYVSCIDRQVLYH